MSDNIFQYFNGYLISGGYDRTKEFLWIHDDENRAQMLANLTCNARGTTNG